MQCAKCAVVDCGSAVYDDIISVGANEAVRVTETRCVRARLVQFESVGNREQAVIVGDCAEAAWRWTWAVVVGMRASMVVVTVDAEGLGAAGWLWDHVCVEARFSM